MARSFKLHTRLQGKHVLHLENCIIYILKKSIFDLQMQTCSYLYSDQISLSVRKPVVYKIKKPVSIVKRDEAVVFDAFLQQTSV